MFKDKIEQSFRSKMDTDEDFKDKYDNINIEDISNNIKITKI